MKLYQLGKGVAKIYRSTVKGNENTPHEQIQRKLTRNILLAEKFESWGDATIYAYGRLRILVVDNRIVWVQNGACVPKVWQHSKHAYKRLNEALGITH